VPRRARDFGVDRSQVALEHCLMTTAAEAAAEAAAAYSWAPVMMSRQRAQGSVGPWALLERAEDGGACTRPWQRLQPAQRPAAPRLAATPAAGGAAGLPPCAVGTNARAGSADCTGIWGPNGRKGRPPPCRGCQPAASQGAGLLDSREFFLQAVDCPGNPPAAAAAAAAGGPGRGAEGSSIDGV
jgi:hypothetical protein